MREAWPNAVLVHLPVHASWLNQVEIYFSILQRKAIATGDFADLDDLEQRILAFQNRYNHSAETLRLEVHQRRPQPIPRPPQQRRHTPRTRCLTPDELTTVTTRNR